MRKWWVAALGLGLAAVVALVGRKPMHPDVSRPRSSAEARSVDSMLRIQGGELLAPTSAPVAPGRSYPFQVGHCGLLHVVDFSASYWVVEETTLSAGERGQFGINGNQGTMTLVDSETAVFRSGVGGEATLRRYIGVLERWPCF